MCYATDAVCTTAVARVCYEAPVNLGVFFGGRSGGMIWDTNEVVGVLCCHCIVCVFIWSNLMTPFPFKCCHRSEPDFVLPVLTRPTCIALSS